MSTLKIELSISSSSVGSDKLKLPYNKQIEVVPPFVNSGQGEADAVSGDNIVSLSAADTLVYLLNTDETNSLVLSTNAGVVFGIIPPKEPALFTVKTGSGLNIKADADTVVYEASFWSKQ